MSSVPFGGQPGTESVEIYHEQQKCALFQMLFHPSSHLPTALCTTTTTRYRYLPTGRIWFCICICTNVGIRLCSVDGAGFSLPLFAGDDGKIEARKDELGKRGKFFDNFGIEHCGGLCWDFL